MGDISELRGLVTSISFLGVLILLLIWLPANFYTLGSYRTVEPPDIFDGFDIYSYADTATLILNETGGYNPPLNPSWYIEEIDDGDGQAPIDIGGHDVDLWYKDANETDHKTRHEHFYSPFIIVIAHWQEYYDKNGVNLGNELDVSDMEANREIDNATSRFKVKCDHFSMDVIYGYNTTLYANFTHAWDFHALNVFHGVNFDQVSTSYNAFDLIAKLLFFQLPNTNIYVNAIMAIPLWACIAYLIYIFILRTIGAIFGGGA